MKVLSELPSLLPRDVDGVAAAATIYSRVRGALVALWRCVVIVPLIVLVIGVFAGTTCHCTHHALFQGRLQRVHAATQRI